MPPKVIAQALALACVLALCLQGLLAGLHAGMALRAAGLTVKPAAAAFVLIEVCTADGIVLRAVDPAAAPDAPPGKAPAKPCLICSALAHGAPALLPAAAALPAMARARPRPVVPQGRSGTVRVPPRARAPPRKTPAAGI